MIRCYFSTSQCTCPNCRDISPSIRLMFWPGQSLTGRRCSSVHEVFKPSTLIWTLTLLPVKSCLQVGKVYPMLSYFIFTICAILASDLWLKWLRPIKNHWIFCHFLSSSVLCNHLKCPKLTISNINIMSSAFS